MTRIVLFFFMVIISCGKPKEQDWLTYYEKSNFLETPRYDETIRYIRRLENASPWLRLTYFGTSPEGRKLPLVIVDKSGKFAPLSSKLSNKSVILIQAGIHAGEIDGKDAGLMLIRDMVIYKKYADLLDRVTILFMPIFNVDGHERFGPYNRINQNGPKEMGWRVTSQNLNLNRDYMKADAPEMRDWLKVFSEWIPDFFIDCHVTDGADHRYVVTYNIDETQNVVEPVRTWTTRVCMPFLKQAMLKSGFPLSPYVELVDEKDMTKGIIRGIGTPRYSTGYVALRNRPALLIETHMLKNYKMRVDGTYQTLLHALELVAQESESLHNAVTAGDEETEKLAGKKLPLTFEQDRTYEMIDFQGFNFRTEKSSISNDQSVIWENVPIDYKIRYFNAVRETYACVVPFAFIIPQQWKKVIEILALHGIHMQTLRKEKRLRVDSYYFQNIRWPGRSFEGRDTMGFDLRHVTEEKIFHEGDYLVSMNQPGNRIIMHLLEPKAPDSFVQWGFFNALFEQKEFGESYKLEILAQDMMRADSALKREFEQKVASDTVFAGNAFARLNWFYMRSPYWDPEVNHYPIGKIMNASDLN